jgi:hypothetical protein
MLRLQEQSLLNAYQAEFLDLMVGVLDGRYHLQITAIVGVRVLAVLSALSSGYLGLNWNAQTAVSEEGSVLGGAVGSHSLQGVWATEAES